MLPINFGTRRGFWIAMALASATMAAGGGAMLLVAGAVPGSPGEHLLALACLLFFGGCAVVGVQQAMQRGPRLTIDDHGVLDRTLTVGVIAWPDIEDASVYRINGNPFIGLELRDAAKYTSRLSPVMQRLVQANVALGYPTLSLNLAGLNADPEQLGELLVKEALLRNGAPPAGRSIA